MKMNKTLAYAAGFARLVKETGMEIHDAVEIVMLAERVFSTGERDANTGSDASFRAYDRATNEFAKKAEELGFSAQFPGLWPNLVKDGVEVRIPSQN